MNTFDELLTADKMSERTHNYRTEGSVNRQWLVPAGGAPKLFGDMFTFYSIRILLSPEE